MRKFLLLFLLYGCLGVQPLLFSQQEKARETNAIEQRPSVEITVKGNKIQIENAPVGKTIQIFSVVGLKINEYEIKSSSTEYDLDVPKGYYILKLGETVRKIAIR